MFNLRLIARHDKIWTFKLKLHSSEVLNYNCSFDELSCDRFRRKLTSLADDVFFANREDVFPFDKPSNYR